MKFEESLREGLVPEWQDQYLDYKQGKKQIKKLRKLKEEYETEVFNNLNFPGTLDTNINEPTSDRTPLLDLSEPQEAYTIEPYQPPISAGQQSEHTRKRRRLSIFDFSIRTPPTKKDEFYSEKENFMTWLNTQAAKVDDFYIEKEQDAYERFLLLEDQLYELRDQKNQLMREKSHHDLRNHRHSSATNNVVHKVNDLAYHTRFALSGLNKFELPTFPSMKFLKKLKSKKKKEETEDQLSLLIQESVDLNYAENRIRNGDVELVETASSKAEDPTSASEAEGEGDSDTMAVPDAPPPVLTQEQIQQSNRRDYAVKKQHFGVPYLFAKKQLKHALLEHYRALSLLQSFKTLNRTGFRKITKKFDKAMGTEIMEPFLKKLDTTSYFVTSDLLEKLINQVEELYIAFFDPGSRDRKHALEKLRTIAYTINASEMRPPTFYKDFFVGGLFLGFGLPLFVLALYTALHKNFTGEMPEATPLLQIWGGFFLLNLALVLFTLNLAIFDKYKINYKFIFEFNVATALNYKQFLVLPAFGFTLLSLVAWFSFNDFWPHKFPGRDWPWIYFGIVVVIFLWPGKRFYGTSRRWLQVAMLRLIFSGLYPVEFRDFFLGDIVSSLTYSLSNSALFFCLYSHHWKGTLGGQNPADNTCGSNNSRVMGFLATLPSLWRFLQCIRRYMDTGDWFPHLANSLKYSMSAIYYITLSIYRIDRRSETKAVFIVFACINSIYTSIWDIVMDWSLLQSDSKHFLLRDHLFYKKPIYYYLAMVADVVLRFQWVFYAFFGRAINESAATGFLVALAELFRRFIWLTFRMENEHATNVFLFRASKDTPLPYSVSKKVEKAVKKLVELRYYAKYPEDVMPEEEQQQQQQGESTAGTRPATANVSGASARAYSTAVRDSRDEEASVAVSRRTMVSSEMAPHKQSTFSKISTKLNRAHIKDFQRRKTTAEIEEDSDDDDDDDLSLAPLKRTPTRASSRLTSVRDDTR
ncbi:Protein SYG1 [Candida viswanathii]|uniref:Protein SYG1 n=1 Tax=Candida viswanathii TaxID=5486 RepID=A0A367XRG2_9ASCO|nr:Protein SYG1 [Candida viswanathii]